jgi:capsular exopolysaccharide synthesis family protein
MELKSYLRFIWRWLWLIVLLGAALAAIGWATASRQTSLYAASAKLLVNQDQGRFAAPSPTLEDLRARERFSLTVMEVIKTRTVLGEAIKNLGLEGQLGVGTLLNRVRTEPIPGTEVFTLEVRDPSRERAVLLADEIVRTFQANERTLLDNPFAQASSLILVENPVAAPTPVSPNIPRDTLLALAVGVLLALAIGFLKDYFDDGMGGGGDMERRLGAAPIAEIGTIKGATAPARLITRSDPQAPDAETYRMLRGHIDSFPAGQPPRTLVVTSPDPQAGKSLTAANLAVGLAQTGRRVVLVDANLRRPALHEYFGLANESGLSTLLTATDGSPAPYLRATGVDGLRLLPAGPASPQAPQLLGSAAFAGLVARLRDDADLVILDSPSLLAVVDAALLTEHADATLLVARAAPGPLTWLSRRLRGRATPATPAQRLRAATEQLQQARASVLGVLLNDVSGLGGRDQRSYRTARRSGGAAAQATPGASAERGGAAPLASKTGD